MTPCTFSPCPTRCRGYLRRARGGVYVEQLAEGGLYGGAGHHTPPASEGHPAEAGREVSIAGRGVQLGVDVLAAMGNMLGERQRVKKKR